MSDSDPHALPAAAHVRFRGYVRALDGVRGLAIAMVLFHHLWPFEWSNAVTKIVSNLSHVGWLGVDLFFVLSGFLISGILLDARGKPNYFKNFIVRRSLRIFPLYFLFLLICLVCLPWALSLVGISDPVLVDNRQAAPWFLTYTSNYLTLFDDPSVRDALAIGPLSGIQNGTHEFLAITWSLAVEEQFYLIWPAVVLLLGPRLLRVAGVVILTALALRFVVQQHVLDWRHVTNMATFCRMDSLAMGAGIAWYLRSPGFRLETWRRFLRVGLYLMGPLLAVDLLVLGGSRSDPLFALLGYTASGLFFAALVGAALSTRAENPARRLFESRPLVFLGKYSYGLYLYHMLFWYLLDLVQSAELSPDGTPLDPERFDPFWGSSVIDAPVRMFVVLGVTLVMAMLSYHAFEKHFLGLKRFFVD